MGAAPKNTGSTGLGLAAHALESAAYRCWQCGLQGIELWWAAWALVVEQ